MVSSPGGAGTTLLLTIVPVGLGLGDPLALVTASLSPGATDRWHRVLDNRVLRFLTFPAVAPALPRAGSGELAAICDFA